MSVSPSIPAYPAIWRNPASMRGNMPFLDCWVSALVSRPCLWLVFEP
jgi:hypothetical protein